MHSLQTGDLVFFQGRGPVQSLIRFGQALGCWLRFRRAPMWIPHHVEIADTERGETLLWGAHALAGFISKPATARLSWLRMGVDYRVVHLPLFGHRVQIDETIRDLHGTDYEGWPDVIRTWRDGNTKVGPQRLFCSEAVVRILQRAGVGWVQGVDANNETPLELYERAIRHAVN